MKLAVYSGHEWRAAVDDGRASTSHVVCAECAMRARIGQWPDVRCKKRLAPIDWLPLAERAGAGVVEVPG